MEAVLIPGLNEYFLDKKPQWFSKNFSRILKARSLNPWWRKNTIILEKDQEIRPVVLLRQLDELGYEKVRHIDAWGQFSHLGDTLKIFPIGQKKIYQLEFLANTLERISLQKVSLLSKEELFQERIRERFLQRLERGDFVVHLDHGIGRFGRFQKIDGRDYFVIEYAQKDLLCVPRDLAHKKLSPYIGFTKPKIYRLGGTLWLKTKKRAKKEIEKMAREILRLYAKRSLVSRPPYPPDDELQRQFEAEFEYELTIDQENALTDIKKDLSSPRPMDRIICGDVGFGKTEVALRAAFKVIMAGGVQVALLTPTTILADQHFWNARKRFEKTGLAVEVLSRALPFKEQKRILADLKSGKIDLLIGTHRILSKDVVFKNLGMVIIDEEQKFGVRQKEKLKNLRAQIDILSLTATPIPRSLNLALSGIWDISPILTPPLGKKPIKTHIGPFDIKTLERAIRQELARGGQVYYLYNRITDLEKVKKALARLFPQSKIAVAHGQMQERQLLKIIRDFRQGKISLLLATTIIENGLDLPNVNTLIVEGAERLGLSQAHQIRGRIGRKDAQAFAYFFYRPQKLTFKARQRLANLKRFQELGDGYQLALKDLEIRGAGNILGKEQAGHISAVGLNLYTQMLNQAVEKLKHSNYKPRFSEKEDIE